MIVPFGTVADFCGTKPMQDSSFESMKQTGAGFKAPFFKFKPNDEFS